MAASTAPGVPYRLLGEFKNRRVEVETSTGDTFRGVLYQAEENLSVTLSEVKATFVDGNKAEMESIYVKGNQVRLISLDDSAKSYLSRWSDTRGSGARSSRGSRARSSRGGRDRGPRRY